jgi:hypothetical protein
MAHLMDDGKTCITGSGPAPQAPVEVTCLSKQLMPLDEMTVFSLLRRIPRDDEVAMQKAIAENQFHQLTTRELMVLAKALYGMGAQRAPKS